MNRKGTGVKEDGRKRGAEGIRGDDESLKSGAEGTTRLAMLKNGEADIAYAFDGPEAEEVKRDSKLRLVDTRHASINWIEFAGQWDPKSPWHDKRVRLAVNYALDRQTISDAACAGFGCPGVQPRQ